MRFHTPPPKPRAASSVAPLIAIVQRGLPFTSGNGQAFVRFPIQPDGFFTLPVRSQAYRNWFFAQYFAAHDALPSARAYRAILHFLEAQTNHDPDNQRLSVYRRVGARGQGFIPDQILLDLANAEGNSSKPLPTVGGSGYPLGRARMPSSRPPVPPANPPLPSPSRKTPPPPWKPCAPVSISPPAPIGSAASPGSSPFSAPPAPFPSSSCKARPARAKPTQPVSSAFSSIPPPPNSPRSHPATLCCNSSGAPCSSPLPAAGRLSRSRAQELGVRNEPNKSFVCNKSRRRTNLATPGFHRSNPTPRLRVKEAPQAVSVVSQDASPEWRRRPRLRGCLGRNPSKEFERSCFLAPVFLYKADWRRQSATDLPPVPPVLGTSYRTARQWTRCRGPSAHHFPVEPRAYRRLLSTLASRARRLGSRDPEGAAQETLKRSLQHPQSQSAVEYYFSEELPDTSQPCQWPLDQLFAWLHGVLRYVVREEHVRLSFRREVPIPFEQANDNRSGPADPSPNQLDVLLQSELRHIVAGCLPHLHREYRDVLTMRMDGLAYSEIAARLRVNENTVATWVSRGVRSLAQCVRLRTAGMKGVPHA